MSSPSPTPPSGWSAADLATLAELRVFSPLRYRLTLDGEVRQLAAMLGTPDALELDVALRAAAQVEELSVRVQLDPERLRDFSQDIRGHRSRMPVWLSLDLRSPAPAGRH